MSQHHGYKHYSHFTDEKIMRQAQGDTANKLHNFYSVFQKPLLPVTHSQGSPEKLNHQGPRKAGGVIQNPKTREAGAMMSEAEEDECLGSESQFALPLPFGFLQSLQGVEM